MFIILYNFRVKRNEDADKMLQVLKVIPQHFIEKLILAKCILEPLLLLGTSIWEIFSNDILILSFVKNLKEIKQFI